MAWARRSIRSKTWRAGERRGLAVSRETAGCGKGDRPVWGRGGGGPCSDLDREVEVVLLLGLQQSGAVLELLDLLVQAGHDVVQRLAVLHCRARKDEAPPCQPPSWVAGETNYKHYQDSLAFPAAKKVHLLLCSSMGSTFWYCLYCSRNLACCSSRSTHFSSKLFSWTIRSALTWTSSCLITHRTKWNGEQPHQHPGDTHRARRDLDVSSLITHPQHCQRALALDAVLQHVDALIGLGQLPATKQEARESERQVSVTRRLRSSRGKASPRSRPFGDFHVMAKVPDGLSGRLGHVVRLESRQLLTSDTLSFQTMRHPLGEDKGRRLAVQPTFLR